MSWSATFESLDALERDEQVSGQSFEQLSTEGRAQRNALRRLAKDAITSGAIGAPGRDYNITIGGHADDRPIEKGRLSHDSLYLSVYEKDHAAGRRRRSPTRRRRTPSPNRLVGNG
jgi:hypothetical protein